MTISLGDFLEMSSRLFGRKEKQFSEKVFVFLKSRLKKFINITKSPLKKFYTQV